MRNIQDIYIEYQVLPNIAEHMYKVAAVADIINSHFKPMIDKKSIIDACLLHDIGKIVEIDLDKFPDFLAPEGKDHWASIKKSFIDKYRTVNEHTATLAIATDLGLNFGALEILHISNFLETLTVKESGEFEKMIALYADLRVGPYGIMPMKERLADLEERYKSHPKSITKERREFIEKALQEIEQEIFKNTDITPDFITEAMCVERIPKLKEIKIG
jgi:hypothetical protein